MVIKIAVCDDEVQLCAHVEKMLINILSHKYFEYDIDVFYSGEALCEGLKRTKYDLIFLDIELPMMNGVEKRNLVKETKDGVPTIYTYNNANRLVIRISDEESLAFTYDANGALYTERDTNSGRVTKIYTNDANGRMVSAKNYEHAPYGSGYSTKITTTDRKLDDNGYVTEEKTSVSKFITVGGMTLVSPDMVDDVVETYTYDYTADVPTVIESSSTDGTVEDYLYANGRTGVIVTNKNGDDGDAETNGYKQLFNLSTDRNGTTRFATDREGNVVAGTKYGTWAEVEIVEKIQISDTIDLDITSSYTGYIYNAEQNLWNAGERMYSASLRHFTSPDPEPGNVYEKMRVNAYVYAGNNNI